MFLFLFFLTDRLIPSLHSLPLPPICSALTFSLSLVYPHNTQVNTERFVQESKGLQHTQGAWPKEVKTAERQDKERFVRRIENLKEYQNAVRHLTAVVENTIKQNNTLDLYEEYFTNLPDTVSSEPPAAKTVSVFRDPNEQKRAATQISWHPDGTPKLAVSYSSIQFQRNSEDVPVSSYIWDVANPNEPDFELQPRSPLTCVKYNPRMSDHVVGGSYNGAISFWDLRKGNQPIETSVLEQSHHDPVYAIYWIQSRSGNECCSISTDGQMLWWDVRNLGKGPIDSFKLERPDGLTFGASCLEYRSDAGATRFLVGTEQGQPVLIDRKAKKDADSQITIKAVYGADIGRHHGRINTIQRNPFSPKYFMSVGDWTTRLWNEDLKQPVLTSYYESAYVTSSCWSPTRPSVFFVTKSDATLEVWDFYYKQNDPVFSTKVGDCELTSVSVHKAGRLVAVGSADGTTSILEISDSLALPQPNEKQSLQVMFERETKREKNLEIRYNQRRKDARKAANKRVGSAAGARNATAVDRKGVADDEDDDGMEDLIKKTEASFYAAIGMTAPDTTLTDELMQVQKSISNMSFETAAQGSGGGAAEAEKPVTGNDVTSTGSELGTTESSRDNPAVVS
jgi:dynein axonemal intermediate chain 2